MINKVYRLVGIGHIVANFEETSLNTDQVIVRPTRLSICAADQRYYTGSRGIEIMKKKLPMALIHEGVGIVIHDPSGEFNTGDTVVMIPNTPVETDDIIAENYLRSSKFRASGFDGFMQDYVFMDKDRLVKYTDINHEVASFLEIISVAIHSIDRLERKSHSRRNTIAIWGDGNIGFICSLVLKHKYPDCKIVVVGKNPDKLSYFSFVDEIYLADDVPTDLKIDHAIEAVGGQASSSAINQIIDMINPEGTISLLGVSENPVEINTRMVLEKGLTLIGSSRSGKVDFQNAVNFLETYKEVQDQLCKLVSAVIEVRTIDDMMKAFEYDLSTPFKTIMEWNV